MLPSRQQSCSMFISAESRARMETHPRLPGVRDGAAAGKHDLRSACENTLATKRVEVCRDERTDQERKPLLGSAGVLQFQKAHAEQSAGQSRAPLFFHPSLAPFGVRKGRPFFGNGAGQDRLCLRRVNKLTRQRRDARQNLSLSIEPNRLPVRAEVKHRGRRAYQPQRQAKTERLFAAHHVRFADRSQITLSGSRPNPGTSRTGRSVMSGKSNRRSAGQLGDSRRSGDVRNLRQSERRSDHSGGEDDAGSEVFPGFGPVSGHRE